MKSCYIFIALAITMIIGCGIEQAKTPAVITPHKAVVVRQEKWQKDMAEAIHKANQEWDAGCKKMSRKEYLRNRCNEGLPFKWEDNTGTYT